jgi:hypothetical protein
MSDSNLQNVSRFQIRSRAVKRLLLWHVLSRPMKLGLVTEFPKSGGTWFTQMLARASGLPFDRNTSKVRFRRCLLHGHHLHSSRFHRPICVVRDGRDVMVSAYYHFLFPNEINHPPSVQRFRSALGFSDFDDIRSNLPAFIDYLYSDYLRDGFKRFTWTQFIDSWWHRPCLIIRYEQLLTDAAEALRQSLRYLHRPIPSHDELDEVVEAFSFRRMTGRQPGQHTSGSFARKGVAGDWVNHFSFEAKQTFLRHAGAALVQAGYESNDSWASDTDEPPGRLTTNTELHSTH